MFALLNLRRATIVTATALSALLPATGGGTVVKAAAGLTAAAFVAMVDEAEARPRVRDHRTASNKKPKLPLDKKPK